MSDTNEPVVTGEDEIVAQSDNDAPVESKEATPPVESDEVVNLRKEVSGLKSAASSERHKRQTAEKEIDRLNIAPKKADDFDPFDEGAINRVVDSRMAEKTAEVRQTEANKEWNDRIEQGQKDHPDADIAKIIQDESFYPYVSDAMAEVIRTSSDGVEVMLHLNSNREELHQLAQLSPVQAAQKMGRISQQLKADGNAKVSNASDPITPVGSRSVSTKDTDDMNLKEYEAHIREQRGGSVFA